MIFQVLRFELDYCVVVESFGSRRLAEEFLRRQKKNIQRKLAIVERSIRSDSPALNYPYLPGMGR